MRAAAEKRRRASFAKLDYTRQFGLPLQRSDVWVRLRTGAQKDLMKFRVRGFEIGEARSWSQL